MARTTNAAKGKTANVVKPAAGKTEPVGATKGSAKASRAKDKKAPPAIRGEKVVRKTKTTVPVGPSRRARGTHDGPTDPAAIDRRKQFSGTDEPADPKRGSARRPSGGSAGRAAVGLPGRV